MKSMAIQGLDVLDAHSTKTYLRTKRLRRNMNQTSPRQHRRYLQIVMLIQNDIKNISKENREYTEKLKRLLSTLLIDGVGDKMATILLSHFAITRRQYITQYEKNSLIKE